MKSSTTKKVMIAVVTTATALAPYIPKLMDLNTQTEIQTRTEKPYSVVTTQCKFQESYMDDKNHQVCTYRCTEGDNLVIHKVMYGHGMICQSTIQERVKKTNK